VINSKISAMRLQHFKIYCEVAISSYIIKRAIKISLVVGTTLNLINQGEILITGNFEELHLLKLFLTYLVPYSVTTYTATVMRLEFLIGTKAVIDADLECKKCGRNIHVHKNELIPECPSCGVYTHWKLR